MRRREFIMLLSGAVAAWPTAAARAQQGGPVIGYLSSGSPQGFATRLAAFRRGLEVARWSRCSEPDVKDQR